MYRLNFNKYRRTITFVAFLGISCHHQEAANESVPDFLRAHTHPSTPVGEWTREMFIQSERLSIKPDHTFTYYQESDIGRKYSCGKWVGFGKNIQLKSFETYNPETNKNRLSHSGISNADTVNAYLDYTMFRLEGDKLFEFDKEGKKLQKPYSPSSTN